jgi:hypothetical protein
MELTQILPVLFHVTLGKWAVKRRGRRIVATAMIHIILKACVEEYATAKHSLA